MAITKPYDHIMKILARTYPEYFLKLIFPGIPVQLIGTLDNVELALEIVRVDFLHQININGDDACLHIDFEHRHKGPFPRRVFSYNGMLTELKKPIPIISVPIYLKRRQKKVPKSPSAKRRNGETAKRRNGETAKQRNSNDRRPSPPRPLAPSPPRPPFRGRFFI